MDAIISTAQCVTKQMQKIPRLPKLSIRNSLPLLSVCLSPSTVLVIQTGYQLYSSTQTVYETLQQPLTYYYQAKACVNFCRKLCKPKNNLSEYDVLDKLCQEEWVMLFPDDEHKTLKQ